MGAPRGNKNAIGNEGGRPPIFNSPKELQKKIDAYFNGGANERIIVVGLGTIKVPCYTICGLAYYLGFVSRQSLSDYEAKVEFTDIIKKARLRIEMAYEERLSESACTGAIFALKNMEWKDKSEITGKNGEPLFMPARVLSKTEAQEYLKDLEDNV